MNFLILADASSTSDGFSGPSMFFLLAGISSAIVAAFLTVGGLLGLDSGDDLAVPDHGGAEAFSLRAITGFFLGLGWVGFGCECSGFSHFVSSVAGVCAGSLMMGGIVFALRSMKRLRSDGTVKYSDAIGATGVVYVTTPPSGAPGGQVTVIFSNRQETLPSVQAGDLPLPAGTRVRVLAASGGTLTIERL
jgi:membrane protein implicated in regulation of membrane protease activity